MGVLTIYDQKDLKQIYRALKEQLLDNPDLIDSEFLQDLQAHLQYRASTEGVDLSNHTAWDAWLSGEFGPPPPRRPLLRLVTAEE